MVKDICPEYFLNEYMIVLFIYIGDMLVSKQCSLSSEPAGIYLFTSTLTKSCVKTRFETFDKPCLYL